ncbi:MAG: UDP-N-acetylenolpyruvoylglucosamine reductase [Myxococcales bacterium]|nr:UDP-N-acetylenolpyruvoylglucosamine reductase [Myxococcales bacterium]
MRRPGFIQGQAALASRCTLAVGGDAEFLARASSVDQARDALQWAREQAQPVTILGGGSNCLVADEGLDGMVLQFLPAQRRTIDRQGDHVHIGVAAGHDWDRLVEWSVKQGLCGIECLSGIPGLVGAAPMQNIGAYGQQLDSVLEAVTVLDVATGLEERIPRGDLGLGYRSSHLKGEWAGRFLVLEVELMLRTGRPDQARYGQLQEALAAHPEPSLAQLRDAVLGLRRSKSMVYDRTDPNHRSAGSFFMNPRLIDEDLLALEGALADHGADPEALPRYPDGDRWKVPAAWLIEAAGFKKGLERGPVGLSSNHSLALINRGRARAQDLINLAREIHQGVAERFGVRLWPEPVFLGFEDSVEDLLEAPK